MEFTIDCPAGNQKTRRPPRTLRVPGVAITSSGATLRIKKRHGQNDYTTSLSLATVLERNLLLAYRVNNSDLIARNGYPFQLAAEDKGGYKWCKWIVRIELSTDPDFKGFWERQGYGNDAEISPSPRVPSSLGIRHDIKHSGLWCAMLQKKNVQLS